MTSCPICFEKINESKCNDNYTTKCQHIFHNECLLSWTRQNNSCPMCRTKNIMVISNLNTCMPEFYQTTFTQNIIHNSNNNR